MKSIEYIKQALASLDQDVEQILFNQSISLTDKDDLMLPILQQKRVLTQTLEDLTYLKEHPPAKGGMCKPGIIREEEGL